MRALLLTLSALLIATACSSFKRVKAPPRLNVPGIIDINASIGQFPARESSLENLLTNLHRNNISLALVANIEGASERGGLDKDEVTINEQTARITEQHRELKPVVWAKPGAKGASADLVEPFLRDRGFLAIRFHPDLNNFTADSPAVYPYMELCKRYGVPALFHCGRTTRSNARTIYSLARKYPTVPVILLHMGFGTNHEEAIAVAKEAKERGDANIYLDTSQVDMASLQLALDQVGADRILFGSDATYFGKQHYEFYVNVVGAIKVSVTENDFRKVIRENALKLFKIASENVQTEPTTTK
ncbi:MAG: amidohydrolase family protein [Acidobacteriota bacterium]|nr:amidohydrolase family protein [Blastocatellia bacterium]MDW8411335.1 amidohydrolase family protein [Acidobacteriota bacterium]